MAKFRFHRGCYNESMQTVVEVADLQELIDHIKAEIPAVVRSDFTISRYGETVDDRNGWDTHIVTATGYGVIGFTDQMVTATPWSTHYSQEEIIAKVRLFIQEAVSYPQLLTSLLDMAEHMATLKLPYGNGHQINKREFRRYFGSVKDAARTQPNVGVTLSVNNLNVTLTPQPARKGPNTYGVIVDIGNAKQITLQPYTHQLSFEDVIKTLAFF